MEGGNAASWKGGVLPGSEGGEKYYSWEGTGLVQKGNRGEAVNDLGDPS